MAVLLQRRGLGPRNGGKDGQQQQQLEQEQHEPLLESAQQTPRLAFIDSLRLVMLAAVILHSCVTQLTPDAAYWWGVYRHAGNTPLATRLAFSFLVTLLQSHVWGLLFLASGFLAPGSVARKGPLQFLHDKTLRLLLPLAAWELLLRPACFYVAHASGFGLPACLPQPPREQVQHGSTVVWLFRWYFAWFRAVGESHMWFVGALFLLQAAYVGVQQAHEAASRHPWPWWLQWTEDEAAPQPFMTRNVRRQQRRIEQLQLLQHQQQSPFYSARTAAALAALSACLVALTFAVLSVSQFDWSLRVINVQLCFVPQHVAAFVLGVLLRQRDMLPKLPPAFCYRCMCVGLCVFVAGWLPDALSLETDVFPAWLNESTALWNGLFAVYTQVFAVLWSVGLLVLLQRACSPQQPSCDKQAAAAGCRRRLVRLSFAAFVLHPMVLIAFSLVSSLQPLMFVACAWLVVGVGSFIAAAAVGFAGSRLAFLLEWPAFQAAVSTLSGEWLPWGQVKQLLQGAEHVL